MMAMDESRWASLTLPEQMANIGSEVGRSSKWLSKGKQDMAESAFLRCLDLIDLTIKYGRNGSPLRASLLKELCRAREYYVGAYELADVDALSYLDSYFGQFAHICRRQQHEIPDQKP